MTSHLTDEEYLQTLTGEAEERFLRLLKDRYAKRNAMTIVRILEKSLLRVQDSLQDETMNTISLLGYAIEDLNTLVETLTVE